MDFKEWLHETFHKIAKIDFNAIYPIAGKVVDGRIVREGTIPNMSSIHASLSNPVILSGIRVVPISAFENHGLPKFYSTSEESRTKELAHKIKESKTIVPLIVVHDVKGPYILEGGHRFDALKLLGAKSFPAKVVIDDEGIS